MNAILGMTELLNETPLTPEQHDYVQRCSKAGEHLLTLINDILDLSKIETGHLELDQASFELDELTTTVTEFMAVRARARGLKLLCVIAPDVPTALIGDPHRLRQILVNLVGNAIKFTEHGEVLLRVEYASPGQQPGLLRFAVSDTGIGIPSDRLDAIFENFTQVDASTTRKYGGTGLGLSIAQRLTHLMGGQIWVESQVGHGSTFYFTAKFTVDLAPQERLTILPPELQGLRVLVVDNNATNRLILREALVHWGAFVTEADGCEAGLHAWMTAIHEHRPFQLLLVDVNMPGKDGFEFVEQLKEMQCIDTAKVLMLSSDHRPGDRARCQALAITRYLLKPISRPTMLRAIVETLSQRDSQPLIQTSTTPAPRTDAGKALNILVAEDNEDNQMLIESYLHKTPHCLTLANNGAIAVEQYKTHAFDLVFMDVQMPVMDGYTATRRIRQWEQEQQRPQTCIIALTANALTEDIRKSREAGCNRHLAKPIKKAALLEVIAEYAENSTTTFAEQDVPVRQ